MGAPGHSIRWKTNTSLQKNPKNNIRYLNLFVIVINVTGTTVPFVKRQVHCGGGTQKLGTEQRTTCSEREGQKEYQNQSNTGRAGSFLLLVSLGTTSSPSPSCPALFPAFGCVGCRRVPLGSCLKAPVRRNP